MANSLIPYSFIPGTKAMASEVNANFIALAKAVEDGKTFTTESIEQFNTELEERLDESLDSKLKIDLTNCKNITNCILEIPERIKCTFLNGKLTLKSGSVVTVPNGFEEDGVTRKFDEVTITSDVIYSGVSYSGAVLLYYKPTTGSIYAEAIAANSVGGSTGTNTWYDLTANVIKRVTDGTSGISLPIAVGTLRTSAPYITSIDSVFNGFGFMGQSTFVLSGVRALFADGRNADGTLKNKEFVSKTVKITALENQTSQLGRIELKNDSLGLFGYGVTNYFEQETVPSGFGQHALWYNTRENQTYDTGDSGATWNKTYTIELPKLIKTAVSAVITGISMPYPLKIADINDVKTRTNMPVSKGTNGYTKLPNGMIIQWGTLPNTGDPATVTITFPTAFSNTIYSLAATPRMTTNYNDWSFGWVTKSTTSCTMFCKTQGQPMSWVAIGY